MSQPPAVTADYANLVDLYLLNNSISDLSQFQVVSTATGAALSFWNYALAKPTDTQLAALEANLPVARRRRQLIRELIQVPILTTAEQGTVPAIMIPAGSLCYNTTAGKLQTFVSGVWV